MEVIPKIVLTNLKGNGKFMFSFASNFYSINSFNRDLSNINLYVHNFILILYSNSILHFNFTFKFNPETILKKL